MDDTPVATEREFEFFNQTSETPACLKEFKKLPSQVQASLLLRIKKWRSGEELPRSQLSPFVECKYGHMYAFKYSWHGNTYRLIFLVHDGLGVGLTAFKKKSTKKRRTPRSIVDRVEQRHQIYHQGLSPTGTSG